MSLRAPPLVQLNTQPRTVEAAQPQAPTTTTTTTAPTNHAQPPGSAFQRAKRRLKVFLGLVGPRRAQRDRQEIVRLVSLLAYSFVQVVVVLTLTIIGAKTASPHPSDDRDLPASPPQSELAACSLLGAWNILWLGKLFIWGYLEIWVLLYVRRVRAARRLSRRQQRASRADLPPLEFPQGAQQLGPNGDGGNAVQEGEPAVERHEMCPLTWTSLHLFLWKLDPIVTIVWFFSTVLVSFQHRARCHDFARDIADATIVLVLTVYVQYVVTVLLPAIRVLIARRRANQPLVAKLSKRDVDRIPLVLYIPPPPTDTPASPISPLPRSVTHPIPTPLRPPPPPPPPKRRRFISFRPSFPRRDTKRDIADVEQGAEALSPLDDEGDEWDRTWERGSYPFVRLPENRATCMICLSEFEAPRRVSERERERAIQPALVLVPEGDALEMRPLSSPTSPDVEEVQVESPRDADARTIELADTGGSDAPQPLRLLSCGHVYHKECVDAWLIQKSGRCPYCSARVEVPPAPERRKSIWRRGTV
ncbi:hypothetical protein GSI_14277 [Ganoderma sinense ZZ0214-1]|uniref:RING-type domain-containing protein n=1 Tax=Ganoderma sinense ZZ0214-1 TaxID=1077348 RepID=A0A2G8RSP4_9APHY|nr:hypothetical protein GSI_14277 [Ganoderma sinense ZZ0214-1]